MAMFNKQDRRWLVNNIIPASKEEQALIEVLFEKDVDYDVMEIEHSLKDVSYFKRFCTIKLLTFLVELPLILLFYSKIVAKQKIYLSKIYFRFLRNKITLDKLKKELQNTLSRSIII